MNYRSSTMNPAAQHTSSLASALFSQTQQQVLGLIYGNPETSFYFKEIQRHTGMGIATIKRELENLVQAGIVQRRVVGNQHHYYANQECPIFHELWALVRAVCPGQAVLPRTLEGIPRYPTLQPSDRAWILNDSPAAYEVADKTPDIAALARRYHIKRIALFGSVARNEVHSNSDVDLLVEFEAGKAPTLGELSRLNAELSRFFNGRKVDLVPPSILRNPFRRRAIEKDLKVLYAAG